MQAKLSIFKKELNSIYGILTNISVGMPFLILGVWLKMTITAKKDKSSKQYGIIADNVVYYIIVKCKFRFDL